MSIPSIRVIIASLTLGLTMSSTFAGDIDGKYFTRNVRFSMLKEKVVLVERDRPGLATLDEWPQLVFMSADGEHRSGRWR